MLESQTIPRIKLYLSAYARMRGPRLCGEELGSRLRGNERSVERCARQHALARDFRRYFAATIAVASTSMIISGKASAATPISVLVGNWTPPHVSPTHLPSVRRCRRSVM